MLSSIESGYRDVDLRLLIRLSEVLGSTASRIVDRIPLDVYERAHPTHRKTIASWTVDTPAERGASTETTIERFGQALRTYRRAHVQRPLDLVARDAGVTFSTILKIETGRLNPRVALLLHIADACEVKLSTLLGDAGL